MQKLFDDMPFVRVYIDDIAIFSHTEEAHLDHLRQVLERLRSNGFHASLKKCVFFTKELQFLGHVIGQDGIKPDPAKLRAIEEWPRPTTVSEVRMFLGFVNYYLNFVDR